MSAVFVAWCCFDGLLNRIIGQRQSHNCKPQARMKSHVESVIEGHPLLNLISLLIQVSMSDMLPPSLVKQLSYELIRISPLVQSGSNCGVFIIDQAMRRTLLNLLTSLGGILRNLLAAEEVFKILIAANEPFKRTRRRLPPQAEQELAAWLDENRSHPYPTDEFIESFCANFEGIEEDQVRIFLTNSRRKMTEGGVRKRSKS